MASGDHVSILSSVAVSDNEGDAVTEQIMKVPDLPIPIYTEDELEQLVSFVKRMTILFGLDNRDWTENTLLVICNWFMKIDERVLTIFYDGNQLVSNLGFPIVSVYGLTYFMRKPHEIFTIETFHDEIIHGILDENIDGAFLRTLNLIYAPLFRYYDAWNESVRFRFYEAIDKILANVTGLHYKMAGVTMLYVPYTKDKIKKKASVKDRELVKSLEAIAVQWGQQIRACLTDKILIAQHDLVCPLEEYEFWVYRYEVLQCLRVQLHSDDVQCIVQMLRTSQSVYIKQIEELILDYDNEFVEAKSNVTYLQLLVKPSEALDTAKRPSDIPLLLPRFIHMIRFIWLNSEYYNRAELITCLFRNLSNQIIKFCTAHTNIDKILGGCPRFGILMCNMSIECCLSYKAIFKEIFAQYETSQPHEGLRVDEAMIFNHVDAFEERLNDLIDICQSMIVFGRLDETEKIPKPFFGGTKGVLFEKKSEAVESNFLTSLEAIKKDSKDLILNVHRNEWNTEVLVYREMIRNLEEVVQCLMTNVFQSVRNVEEGLEVLVTFHFYSFRDTLRKTYLGQVSEVWAMFIADIRTTNEKLQNKSHYHESWVSRCASRVMIHRTNLERLTWLEERLQFADWLPVVALSDIAIENFNCCKGDFKKETEKVFKTWTQVFDEDLVPKLDRTLLTRSKVQKGLLECNIDRSILPICDEAHFFHQMGFQIPSNVNKLYSKRSYLKYVYESVITVCLDYNRILAALSPGERKLFFVLTQACDKQIAPAIFKLSWGGELTDEYITDCSKYTQKLQNAVDIYKRSNYNICRACEKICNVIFFDISNTSQTLGNFEKSLEEQCKAAAKILTKQYRLVFDLIQAVWREFQGVCSEMVPQWTHYVQRLDDMMEAAFLTCVRASLMNVFDVLHGCGAVGPGQILSVSVDITDRKISFSPEIPQVIQTFNDILPRITKVLEEYPRLWEKFNLAHYSRSFSAIVNASSDCIAINQNIMQEVHNNVSELNAYVFNWLKFKPVWEQQEHTFLKTWEETKQTAEAFNDNLAYYTNVANEVAVQGTISNVHFVRVNSSKLKNSILDFIDRWQELNVMILKEKASTIKGVYKYMSYNIEKISSIPRTPKEIKEANKLYESLVKEIPEKADEFPSILNLFKVLCNYQIEFPSNTRMLVTNLNMEWQNYIKKLFEAHEMLENTKD